MRPDEERLQALVEELSSLPLLVLASRDIVVDPC
jgi:hypothetical protein